MRNFPVSSVPPHSSVWGQRHPGRVPRRLQGRCVGERRPPVPTHSRPGREHGAGAAGSRKTQTHRTHTHCWGHAFNVM